MKIIIDSGHGGSDPGAVAFGTAEKDLNIVFSNILAEKLASLKFDVDTSLINDKYYAPEELASLIKNSGASLCISCHNNAFNGKARGFETIYSIHSNGTLANYIIDEIKKTGFPVRRAFSRESLTNPGSDYYFIIRLTYPEVETIIIEFGFMDNPEDFSMLTNSLWQDKLVSAVASAVRKYIPMTYESKTPIIGKSILSPIQLKTALKDRNPNTDTALVDLYFSLADIYNIKADLAFLQSMYETNWLKFTGIVKPEQNNFAGLGATGEKNQGEWFPSVEAGVEAHLQHLFAYSTKDPLPSGRILYDTRFKYVQRGSAPNWEDLDGKWAVPGIGYGEAIVNMQKKIFEAYPPVNTSMPPENSNPAAVIQPHWAKICNDELLKAGLIYNDHSETLDNYATEGMVLCLANRLRKEFIKNG